MRCTVDTTLERPDRLENLPISFFAMIMGLAGLTIAWEKAQVLFGLDLGINPWLVGTTASVFALLLLLYAIKLLRYPESVLAELRHPIKLNFFATISISLLLLAIAFLPIAPSVSHSLWWLGTAAHLAVTLYVLNVWMHHAHFEVHHMNPAWFIPAVGNVLVPVAGIPFGYVDVSWFFFSTGVLFWVVLMTIIFSRVLFHHPIDERLLPTLFILIAPPAVGFIAYTRLTGELDTFARMLYFSGLFLTLLLLVQASRFMKLGFSLSWWAYSFPLAAISIASMMMFEHSGTEAYHWIGGGLLLLLTALVGMLLARTAGAIVRHGICLPGH
ncbi:MAG: SLAC1 anion channel family protein [Chromatiaceae bacterium]